ncbi:MAG: TRAP transporter substrate-binding protein [Lawsonibacter sp.]|nr:TRAP transporter substrate-binding protein [Lawsonibacter sp.]
MKNAKRTLALVLTCALSLGLFTACGSSSSSNAAASSAASGSSAAGSSAAASGAAGSSDAASVTTADDGGLVNKEAAAKAEHVITFCDSQPATSLMGQTILQFGEYLQEESDGRIVLEFFPSAMLGNGTTCMQQVQLGSLDMYRCDAAALYDFGVDSMKIVSLPYLFKDRDSAVDTIENSDMGDYFLNDIGKAGVGFVGVGWIIDTPRRFFTRDTEITKIEDMKGLKIRAVETNITLDYKAALGMNPVPLAFSEVYTSLSTGVIDAAANTLDSFVTNKLNEVCKYFIENNGMIPTYPVIFSEATWSKFSAEDQQLIKDCWAKASAEYDVACVANEEKEKADMEAAGVTFCTITDEDKWARACEPMIQQYSVGYEDLLGQLRTCGK